MQPTELARRLRRCAAPAGLGARRLVAAEMHEPLLVQLPQLPGQQLLLVCPPPPQQTHRRQPCPVLGGSLQARLSAVRLMMALQAGFHRLQVLVVGLMVAVQRPAKPP